MEDRVAMDRSSAGVARRIRLAREGRTEALNELLAVHRNYLHLLAGASLDPALRSKADASDVVQETLLQAYEGFPQFRGTTAQEWLGWMRTILSHTLAAAGRRYSYRRRDAARERPLEAAVERSSLILQGLVAASGPSPSQAAQEHERALAVADALADVDADGREVVMLRTFHGLDWSEVGRRMDRSPDAARMLWTRALARIGDLLRERLG